MRNDPSKTQNSLLEIVVYFFLGVFAIYLCTLAYHAVQDINTQMMIQEDLEETLRTEKPISGSYANYKWTTQYSENEYERVASVHEPFKMSLKDINVSRHIGNSAAKMTKEAFKGAFDGLFRKD